MHITRPPKHVCTDGQSHWGFKAAVKFKFKHTSISVTLQGHNWDNIQIFVTTLMICNIDGQGWNWQLLDREWRRTFMSCPSQAAQLCSPVLTAICLVNGNSPFSTPTELTSINWLLKNCHVWLRPRLLRLCKIWWKSVHGGFWANGWNITKNYFIHTYSFKQLTTFSCLMAQITLTHARVYLFWLWLILLPIQEIK